MRCAMRRMAGILAVLATLAPAAEARPRIVGGTAAPSGPYGFVAQVRLDGEFICGGSLVAARYVVTAAHCLSARDGFSVVLGTTARQPQFAPSVPVTVAGADAGMDIGVLRLDASSTIAPVRLPRVEDAGLAAPGAVGRALGWGATDPANRDSVSDALLQVDLTFRADHDCRFPEYDPAVTLCAGDPAPAGGRDSCNGDSGGPLLAPDGSGGAVLAGATSYGVEECGQDYGAYVDLASAQVNAFVRAIVPQVEISPNGTRVVAGRPVTFTATPSDPDGTGPFGGYDELVWDLDGDGFDDARGATVVTRTAAEGVNTVAVRATDAAGNGEVRHAAVVGFQAGTVGFATDAIRVREGRTARISVYRSGAGTGTVVATPANDSAPVARLVLNPGPATLTFDAETSVQTIDHVLFDDGRVEPDKSYAVSLGAPAGDLQVGPDDRMVVTVQDDDAEVELRRTGRRQVRRGAFTVRVDPNTTGRLEAIATAGRRTVARAGSRRIRNARARALRLKLTRAGTRRLARDGVVEARVEVRLTPGGGGLPARATRTVRVG